jgi:hypothetical protein
MIGVCVGLLLPTVAVWLLLHGLRLQVACRSRIVLAALAAGGGLGLSALTTFWLITVGIYPGARFVAIDASVWVGLGLFGLWRIRRSGGVSPSVSRAGRPLASIDWVVRAAFWTVAVLAMLTIVREYAASPHGQWDAWAIWNQKARFLLRGQGVWLDELKIAWSSPGHPLLVPGAVARVWAYAGTETTFAPAAVALVFGASIVAVVMGALDLRRRRAWVAGAVLLAPATFVQQIASQQADIPVGFFIIATLGMLCQEPSGRWRDELTGRSALLLAGMTTSLAAWSKNEGLLFLPASFLLAAWLSGRHGRMRQLGWWIVGATPALLTIAWFKLVVAPVAPIYLAGGGLSTLLDAGRHRLVWSLTVERLISWGGAGAPWALPLGLAAAVAAACMRSASMARVLLAVLGVVLTGYYVVWVITPVDVEFVVSTTFSRVIAQMWPVIVLAVFSTGPPTSRVGDQPA